MPLVPIKSNVRRPPEPFKSNGRRQRPDRSLSPLTRTYGTGDLIEKWQLYVYFAVAIADISFRKLIGS